MKCDRCGEKFYEHELRELDPYEDLEFQSVQDAAAIPKDLEPEYLCKECWDLEVL